VSSQLLDENTGFNRCRRCRHGYMIYNINDLHVGRALDLYGDWAKAESDLFASILRPGAVVLDVGANIGVHTVFFSKAVGPGGQVVAFEPQRLVYQSLCANLAINSLTNVDALNVGVGASCGALSLPRLDYTTGQNFGGISLAADQNGDEVSVATLDSLGLSSVYFIKVDVEGMELEVLRGGEALITNSRPILYVENAEESRSHALIEYLLSIDYHLYWHFSPFFTADNYLGVAEDVFGGLHDANMLCLPGSVDCGLDPVRGVHDTAAQAFARRFAPV
jgi:FkbM family methyltransferase